MNNILRFFSGILLSVLCSFTVSASIPQWYVEPPLDSTHKYYIASDGLTHQKALNKAYALMSQRLLTSVSSTTSQQTHKVNQQLVSEFKQKINTKGLNLSLPSPTELRKDYDESMMTYFYLFEFDKTEVINMVDSQKSDIVNAITNVLSQVAHLPFQCGVVETNNAEKLQLLKGLSLIKSNQVHLNTTIKNDIFDVFDNCFVNRQVSLEIPPKFKILQSYFEEQLVDWNVKHKSTSSNKLIVSIDEREFERFGQAGVKLDVNIKIVEAGDTALQVSQAISGYNPASSEKALDNAQKKLVNKLKQQFKPLLRNINEL